MPTHRLPAVDAYIAKAQPFAQPILHRLRDTIHAVVPEVEEAIKWSRPFFLYKGVILGNISAFKEHCSFGLWGSEMVQALREGGVDSKEGMGSFGRLTSVADLPPQAELESFVRKAAELISEGTRTKSIQRVAKPTPRGELAIPEALAAALKTNKQAAARFAELSPSCRREYAEWIAEAKREETRTKRVATALEWIAEGKSRNWKYERTA
jgi:uncharacterized protein YdeI (YjbR/CyaY-like superfamily)